MKVEALPTTIPPAMGECTTSRTITNPFINDDRQIAPSTDAPIPTINDVGILAKLNSLNWLEISNSLERVGKSANIINDPNSAYEAVNNEELLKACFYVPDPSSLSSLNLSITPNASPINPP